MKTITRSAIVPHGAGEMYALVDDIDAYPRFLPWCEEAKVLERAPGRTRAALTVGLRGVRQSLVTRNDNRPGESIVMRQEQGPFRGFTAQWRFRPLAAHSCEVEFRLEYEFAGLVLAKLLEPVFDRIADTMVDAFTRRAAEVHDGA